MPRILQAAQRAEWWGPISIALFGFALRVWHLGSPPTMSFDEVYYAENAWSMLKTGYAQDYTDGAAERIAHGDLSNLFITGQPMQIVHPDAGKWLIAAGEAVFGMNAFGWRIASAVVGSLAILVLARLVLRLTGSVPVACGAAFLLAIDGMHLTMSRLALLDGFLAFWLLCAVACLVADRDWVAQRLPDRPRRPWQWAAGVCFGLACGTKWSAVYVLAVFGIAAVLWEVGLRRWPWRTELFRSGIPAFGRLVVVAFAVYLATWGGWLANHKVYEARFGHGYGAEKAWGAYIDHPSDNPVGTGVDALRSLWKYHGMTYRFHTGDYLATKTHPYQSQAETWLLQRRPVSAAVKLNIPAKDCGAPSTSSCLRETLILGNPIIWWSGILALALGVAAWIGALVRRKPTAWAVPILGVAATWLPWMVIRDRPIFSYYAVATVPFLIAGIAVAFDAARAHAVTRHRRLTLVTIGGGLVALSAAASVYFWPVWTYGLLRYDAWQHHMWFTTWV